MLSSTASPAFEPQARALPGADGTGLTRPLPALADLPVIFIPRDGRDETPARVLAAGGADYVVKPFSPTGRASRVRAVGRPADDLETSGLAELGSTATVPVVLVLAL